MERREREVLVARALAREMTLRRGKLLDADDYDALAKVAIDTLLDGEMQALQRALVEVAIPLEALRLCGQGTLSDEVWTGIVRGSDVAREALSHRPTAEPVKGEK